MHGRLSPAPRLNAPIASRRRWFVPGFSKSTGGLLHGSWKHISPKARKKWRERLAGKAIPDDVLLVLAFGYSDAPWDQLSELLAKHLPAGFKDFYLWKPRGIEYSQSEFDEILQACDFNFVRGEDSFLRAHWAAASPWRIPFIWQPYRQAQKAHGHKLSGWLNQVAAHPVMEPFEDLHWAFNGLKPAEYPKALNLDVAWQGFANHFEDIRQGLNDRCLALAARPSLEGCLLKASHL